MRISDWSSDVCSSDLGQFQPGAGLQLAYLAVDAERRRNIVVPHQQRQGSTVDLLAETRDTGQRLQLRRKNKIGTRIAHIERLFTHAVARQPQIGRASGGEKVCTYG